MVDLAYIHFGLGCCVVRSQTACDATMALITTDEGDESQPQEVSTCPTPKGATDAQQCVACDGEPWTQIQSFQIGNHDLTDVM